MKFLVILICLTINYLWLKDFDRFDDSWFFRLRTRLGDLTGDIRAADANGWLFSVLLIYLLPMGLLFFILWLAAGEALGIPTMLIHILVVLVAFDRTQPGQLARDFLDCWTNQGEKECLKFLQTRMNYGEGDSQGRDELAKIFGRLLIHRAFERMFVMFFWYMVAGALGVAFAYISYQLQDGRGEEQADGEVRFVANVIGLLEWIPMRLLALTFSLAGNFVRCFDNLKRSFWSAGLESDNGGALYDYARCALSGIVARGGDARPGKNAEAEEIAALQGLLERSQAIWLSVLAVATIMVQL